MKMEIGLEMFSSVAFRNGIYGAMLKLNLGHDEFEEFNARLINF